MLEVSGFWDYSWIVLWAGALGAIGGWAGTLVPQPGPEDAAPGAARPSPPAWAAALLGGVAAGIALAFLTPTETRALAGVETTRVDVLKLVGVSLVVGTAGSAVIRAAQARILATINAEKAEQTRKQGVQQLEQTKDSALNAAESTVRDVLNQVAEEAQTQIDASARQTSPELEDALREHFGDQLPENLAAVVSSAEETEPAVDLDQVVDQAAEQAKSILEQAIEPQVASAKQAVDSAAA